MLPGNLHVNRTPRKDALGQDATQHLDLLDKFRVVDLGQFDQSRSTTYDYGNFLYFGGLFTGHAGDLIHTFADGSTTVANATTTNNVLISATQPGIAHPLGARWNSITNLATTHRFTYADGTTPANNMEDSLALKTLVTATINARKAEMLAYSGPEEWPVTPYYTFNGTDDLLHSEAENLDSLVRRLGIAFGKVPITGQLRISYKKTGPNSIQVAKVQLSGSIDDLYDWAYGGRSVSIGIYTFTPTHPAMTQAGHATLAQGATPESCHGFGKSRFPEVLPAAGGGGDDRSQGDHMLGHAHAPAHAPAAESVFDDQAAG